MGAKLPSLLQRALLGSNCWASSWAKPTSAAATKQCMHSSSAACAVRAAVTPASARGRPAGNITFYILGGGALITAFSGYKLYSGQAMALPHVWMDFESDGEPLGRVVLGLYSASPDVAANFQGLASGSAGYGYQGSVVHRAVRNYAIMAGDITKGDGSGGTACGVPSFITKLQGFKHSRGTVSMTVHEGDIIRSQFFICNMRMAPEVDREMLACGEVLSGMEVVDRISAVPVDQSHRPLSPVTISSCGLMPA